MKKTIIKEFSPTKVLLLSNSGKTTTITTTEDKPFEYDIIEAIWEDIEF